MSDNERFDAVVLGAGPAGEAAVSRLHGHGLRTALVERELVGGECAYWACIPSKTLLRPVEARSEAARAKGVATPERQWDEAVAYRDYMIRNLDDANEIESYERDGVRVYKGQARLRGPGQVEIDGETLLVAARVIIATGSVTRIPDIPGLGEAGFWTNREATTLTEIPESVAIIGGGPVGIELAQLLSRFGAEVHLVEAAEGLIAREDPRVGELIAAALGEEGIDLHLGTEIRSVSAEEDHRRLDLGDGGPLRVRELIVASGRHPRVADLGLETVGIHPYGDGIKIDERCRAGDQVWAIGDVTGVMPFTHVAKYQARIACADIAGEPVAADYSAVPRVVFSDPEVAAVGITEEQARAAELDVAIARVELPEVIARPWTYESDPRGELSVMVDRERRILVGAWAVAPLAGEWIHYAALALKAEISIDILRDTVAQFPTYTEGFLEALSQIEV
ncbi:MAG TPA: NAD(P)/FAD-dependent oxidoreductase [Solirubrobacteraceae bacterium]|jgi:dihydrolipoamide dehydrogenase|nr:NAD(P)/FAD-dependent oxidoreductase [Solirubrobacteraceae bacterium]